MKGYHQLIHAAGQKNRMINLQNTRTYLNIQSVPVSAWTNGGDDNALTR
jgi:hypothetical protein